MAARDGLLAWALLAICLGCVPTAATPADPPAAPVDGAQQFNSAENEFVCTAPLPRGAGTEFAGVVRHVIDGDNLCVGPADGDGATWIEVRLMDFSAPESSEAAGPRATQALRDIAFDRQAECVVTPGDNGRTSSWDRVHAVCRVGGDTIGDMMRAAGIAEGGR